MDKSLEFIDDMVSGCKRESKANEDWWMMIKDSRMEYVMLIVKEIKTHQGL